MASDVCLSSFCTLQGEMKTGCGWVAGCEDCGESKCIAHYDMDAAEDAYYVAVSKIAGDAAMCLTLGGLVNRRTVETLSDLALSDDDYSEVR